MKDTYVAIVKRNPDTELQHFKYVKKKKVNGKWRYYYDVKDALGFDEREAAANADYEYRRAKETADSYNSIQSDPTRIKWYDQKKSDDYYDRAVEAGKKASEAFKEYYKTPLGKIDLADDKIDAIRNKIADMLSKVSTKVRAKEETMTKYRTKK